MRHILLLPLVACTAPVDGLPDELPDIAFHLLNSPEDYAERARPLQQARASLSPGGPSLPGQGWSLTLRDEAVVETTATDLAILSEGAGYRLLSWLPRQEAAEVVVETAWFGGPASGVRLPAGTVLTVEQTRDGEVRVQAENPELRLDAWVPEKQVDHWFHDAPPPVWERGQGELAALRPGAELSAGPEQVPIATWQDSLPANVTVVDRDAGWARVQFRAWSWPVDAWVYEDDLGPATLSGRGSGGSWCTGAGALGTTREPTVRGGAWLYAGPDGHVVGRTLRPLRVDLQEGALGGADLTLPSPFGQAEVWVDASDLLVP